MKLGKLTPEKLHDLILNQISSRHHDVLLHPQIGEDSAVIDFGDYVCVMSTDPITGASKGIGRLAIHVSCNDIVANGAEPIGVQVVLLLPENITEEKIKEIMQEIDQGAAELGIEILGGHTEITSIVEKPIIVSTAIGKARKDQYVTSSGARPGDDIIITKGAGIEGTAILASDCREHLLARGIKPVTLDVASRFFEEVSVLTEGRLATRMGATAMHDVTEGGIYGALYELAGASKAGFELNADEVYIRPETKEICTALEIDPLGLISSGTLMITIPNGQALVAALSKQGIKAGVIGKITEAGRNLWVKGEKQEFILPERDELWRILE